MSQNSPAFFEPLSPLQRPNNSIQAWHESLKLFQEKNPQKSFENLMNYLKPGIQNPTEAVLEHGSVQIHVRVESGHVEIKVPFLSLPEGGAAVAMMRKLLEMNSSGLSRAKVEGQKTYIVFEDDLARCHPDKLMSVLREIALEADHADDLFIKQFNASPLERAATTPFTALEIDQAKVFLKHHWEEIFELLKHAEKLRSLAFLNEVIHLATHRLEYVLQPQGLLRSLYTKARQELIQRRLPPDQVLQNARASFTKMKDLTDAELPESLYRATFSIPLKWEYDEESFIQSLENDETLAHTVPAYMQEKRYEEAASYPMVHLYWLLNTYYLPSHMENKIKDLLKASSGKPWSECAKQVMSGIEDLISQEEHGEENESSDMPDIGLNAYYKMAMSMAKKFMK